MQKEYLNWVLDDDWTWINIIGFSGSILGVLAVSAMVQYKQNKSIFDFIAYGCSVIGIGFLTSILFFESFILKSIARTNPELINFNTGFYTEPIFNQANLMGGMFFSIGMIGLAILMIADKTFKTWKLVLLMIGAPLFGIMLMPGNVRIVGVLLYSVAFIGIGIEMVKTKCIENNNQ